MAALIGVDCPVFLIFYKAPGKLFDKLIRWFTGSKYSHVELVVDNVSYGADAWSGKVRALSWLIYTRDNWEIVPLPTIDPLPTRAFLTAQVGKGYDWVGILGFLIPWWHPQMQSRWYCSELCAAALKIDYSAIAPGSKRSWIRGLYNRVTGQSA